ncbi:hypothetical protein [Paenibacillus sp. GP183]|uniref:hypothetical protein n=1 Tax=Paenibacillus sp. GP183 TaxID=1882751 RepID=UPI00089BF81F|nr:hypothetical protein [Paenibacillus sp. GP183]SEC18454.1 hypothetical protein SAMN05443246_3259 [Paenibacillus sp. GP183]
MKQMINAIGAKLQEKGRCPYDSSCPFGRGNRCAADKLELGKKVQAIIDKINAQPNCMVTFNTMNPSPWECENVWTVRFVDPDEED